MNSAAVISYFDALLRRTPLKLLAVRHLCLLRKV